MADGGRGGGGGVDEMNRHLPSLLLLRKVVLKMFDIINPYASTVYSG